MKNKKSNLSKTKLGQALIEGLNEAIENKDKLTRTTILIDIPKNIRSYHEKILHKMYKLSDNAPCFFSEDMKINNKVKKEFQNHFSPENYEEESAGFFEAWPVMKLLEQAMEIGYRLGSDPEYQKKQNELIKIYKQLESHNLVVFKNMRDFNLFQIKSFVWEDGKCYYIRSDFRNIDNSPIKSEIRNPKITPEAVSKAYKLWLTKMNKLVSIKK